MVNFLVDEKKLYAAFNLTIEDNKRLDEFTKVLHKLEKTIPWACRRIWIDEQLSDNAKCFAVFMLGRYFETLNGGDNK